MFFTVPKRGPREVDVVPGCGDRGVVGNGRARVLVDALLDAERLGEGRQGGEAEEGCEKFDVLHDRSCRPRVHGQVAEKPL
jgi:hypothetical protein